MKQIEDRTQIVLMINLMRLVCERHETRIRNGWAARRAKENAGAKIGEIGGIMPTETAYEEEIGVFGDVDLKIDITNVTSTEGTVEPLHGQWKAFVERIYYEELPYGVKIEGNEDAFVRDVMLIKMSSALDEMNFPLTT